MIEVERQNRALSALHRVLIEARYMAQVGASSVDLAITLDWAEILPTLIAAPVDRTKEFRDSLECLARRFKNFKPALDIFENPELPPLAERRGLAAAKAVAVSTR